MPYFYDEAEKFIKDIYWSHSHDKDNNLSIPDVVGARLVKDNEEKDPEYYAHRAGVVHVTSLSKCLRGVVLEMLGAKKDNPPDTRKLGVFKAGNLFEDFIVEAMGDKMLDRQTEYVYKYKGIIVTGRDDGTIFHEGKRRMLENKSVHSDSFWYREKEGTLVAANNQQQIQTYLWLRRILPNVFIVADPLLSNENGIPKEAVKETVYTNLSREELIAYKNWQDSPWILQSEKPDESELGGIFCYISKDDCMIAQAPVKFNQRIIDEVVIPAMELVAHGYEHKNPMLIITPPLTRFEASKHQWQVNWVCKYCEYHNQCAGAGWLLEAQAEVARKNKENSLVNNFAVKKDKPVIGVDTGDKEVDTTVEVAGILNNNTLEIHSIEFTDGPTKNDIDAAVENCVAVANAGEPKVEVSPETPINN